MAYETFIKPIMTGRVKKQELSASTNYDLKKWRFFQSYEDSEKENKRTSI